MGNTRNVTKALAASAVMLAASPAFAGWAGDDFMAAGQRAAPTNTQAQPASGSLGESILNGLDSIISFAKDPGSALRRSNTQSNPATKAKSRVPQAGDCSGDYSNDMRRSAEARGWMVRPVTSRGLLPIAVNELMDKVWQTPIGLAARDRIASTIYIGKGEGIVSAAVAPLLTDGCYVLVLGSDFQRGGAYEKGDVKDTAKTALTHEFVHVIDDAASLYGPATISSKPEWANLDSAAWRDLRALKKKGSDTADSILGGYYKANHLAQEGVAYMISEWPLIAEDERAALEKEFPDLAIAINDGLQVVADIANKPQQAAPANTVTTSSTTR